LNVPAESSLRVLGGTGGLNKLHIDEMFKLKAGFYIHQQWIEYPGLADTLLSCMVEHYSGYQKKAEYEVD
jgi:hypothetical protein